MTELTHTTINAPDGTRRVGGRSDDLVIDCGTCAMRRTTACTDCMVTFLLDADDARTTNWSTAFVRTSVSTRRHPSVDSRRRTAAATQAGREEQSMVFDIAEQRAMRTLSDAGLLPELRYQAGI